MTTTASPVYDKRYALLLNGANFACEVLRSLQQHEFPPTILLLPEYAPAHSAVPEKFALDPQRPRRRILELAGLIPINYAPWAEQAVCARQLRQLEIDFLLVACWPYLIGPELIASARKGALNLHPSMLPLHRGADPVGQQLACGDQRFGVTLHLLSPRFDQGDIIAQSLLPEIELTTDRDRIEKCAAWQGSKLFINAVNGYDDGWRTQPQSQVM